MAADDTLEPFGTSIFRMALPETTSKNLTERMTSPFRTSFDAVQGLAVRREGQTRSRREAGTRTKGQRQLLPAGIRRGLDVVDLLARLGRPQVDRTAARSAREGSAIGREDHPRQPGVRPNDPS